MHMPYSWGRQPVFHITNATYIASRLAILFLNSNYWISIAIIVAGSAFYPVGIRVAYTVSKSIAMIT